MNDFLVFSSLGVAACGAYVIAAFLFKKVWKNQVTHLKLIGFLLTFLLVFVGFLLIFGSMILANVSFGR